MPLRHFLPILGFLADARIRREPADQPPERVVASELLPEIDGLAGVFVRALRRLGGLGGRRDGLERMSDRQPESTATRREHRMAQPINSKQADSDVAPTAGSAVFAGAVAGVAAGVAMAAYLVFDSIVQGMEPFTALEPMGATFRDADALDGGAGSLLFGVSLHLGVSALVGVLFAMVLPRDFTPGNATFLCVGFAFAVMGFMTSVVVPAVNPVLEDSFHGAGGSWVIAHALFGMTTGYVCQRLRQGPAVRAGRHLRHRTV
jgi:hypothetical protein